MQRSNGPMTLALAAGLLLALVLAAGAWLRRDHGVGAAAGPPEAEFLKVLRTAESLFPEAGPAAPPVFPADHGMHPQAPSEAFEIAGWLRDDGGRERAFRFSLVRLAWLPKPPESPSAWAAAAAYRGLFALAGGDGFRFRERFEREALGLAGFDAAAGRLWLDGWSLRLPAAAHEGFTLVAGDGGSALELRLRPEKPPVTADGGDSGRLSGYFVSRLAAEGTLAAGAVTPERVAGSAWLDHAWGRLLPPGGAVALDRFRLQLDDGRDLSIFRLRRRDGSAEPIHRGLLMDAAGRAESLGNADIRLVPEAHWQSPASGRHYPVAFALSLPGRGVELRLSPLVEGQEITGALTGWSGVVRAEGPGGTAAGRGFVDLGG